jgi:hypothetical protein
MKSKLLAATLGVIGATVSATALAAPLPTLPGGPYFIQFSNKEMIAVAGTTCDPTLLTGCSLDAGGTPNEINWGVLLVNTIAPGAPDPLDPNDISSNGAAYFNNVSSNNGQITGIFYGLQAGTPNASNPFPATGGYLDLYYRDLDVLSETNIATALPSLRTAADKATGYTEGTFLARLSFASGIDSDLTNFTVGTVVPGAAGFAGFAYSYANVDTAAGGALADRMDTDGFAPPALVGNGADTTRDVHFRNVYTPLNSWTAAGCTAGVCFGANSTDPATGRLLPEPGSMALVGLGLLGLAAFRRRKV